MADWYPCDKFMPGDGDDGMPPCMDCGSSNITYMPENDIETSATCLECGAEWIEDA